jgi:protein TonB
MTVEGPSETKNTLNSPINDRAEPVVRVDALTGAQQKEISRYLARIRAILEKNKKYPRAARRKRIEGQVPVSFAVLADGSLHDPKIAGQVPEELREATLQLLMNLRLPAPPLSWQTRSRIECTISYRLH